MNYVHPVMYVRTIPGGSGGASYQYYRPITDPQLLSQAKKMNKFGPTLIGFATPIYPIFNMGTASQPQYIVIEDTYDNRPNTIEPVYKQK